MTVTDTTTTGEAATTAVVAATHASSETSRSGDTPASSATSEPGGTSASGSTPASGGTPASSSAPASSLVAGSSVVVGDETAILQVLRNLLGNASRYTPPGTPIEIALTGTVHRDRPAVQVSIRDHGPGLSEGQTEQAFERFWRADSGRVAHGGSGLGLSLAREIAEAHAGTLTLHTHPEGGLEARVVLPRDDER